MEVSGSSKTVDWLEQILNETHLSKFYVVIKNKLLVTRLEHFNFVKTKDLESVGLSRPAARRLLDAVKHYKNQTKVPKNSGLVDKLFGKDKAGGTSQLKTNLAFDHLLASDVNYLINEKDVTLMKKLGDGAFGFVKSGEWNSPSGEKIPVAVKSLKLNVESNPETFVDFIQEVNAMYQLRHSHLIRLYGIVLSTPLMMVQELAPLGCLVDHLRSTSRQHSSYLVDQLTEFCLQLTCACQYLQEHRLIHRDIATRNIFLIQANRIKLGDFGLMKVLPENSDYYFMEEKRKMPFAWCAPESLRSRKFSSASDCWMTAVTFWEIFGFGIDPWKGHSVSTVLEAIESGKRLDRPVLCPTGLYEVMKKCWELEPKSRPSFISLYSQLQSNYPVNSIAKKPLNEEDCLSIEANDVIILIDHKPENFWCFGQNRRTRESGRFPRSVVDIQRRLESSDISTPLKHSFIHTGHMGKQGQWGQPDKIDEVYLMNPMQPPDLLIGLDTPCEQILHSDKKSHTRRNSLSGSGSSFKRKHSSSSVDSQFFQQSRKSLSRSQSVLSKAPGDLIDFSDLKSTEQTAESQTYYVNQADSVQKASTNQNSTEVDRYLNLPSAWKATNDGLNKSPNSDQDPFDLTEVCRGLPQSSPFAEVLLQFAARQKMSAPCKSDWRECVRAKRLENETRAAQSTSHSNPTRSKFPFSNSVQNESSIPPPIPNRMKPPVQSQLHRDSNLTESNRSFSLDSIISQQVNAPLANTEVPPPAAPAPCCYYEDSDFDSFSDSEEEPPVQSSTSLYQNVTSKCEVHSLLPPPVPRRLTNSSSVQSGLSSSCGSTDVMNRSHRILPIKRDGEQVSHTHYWMLPDPSPPITSPLPTDQPFSPPLSSPIPTNQPQEYCNLSDCKKKSKFFTKKSSPNFLQIKDDKAGKCRKPSNSSSNSEKSAISLPSHGPRGSIDSGYLLGEDHLKSKIDAICAAISGVTRDEARVALCHISGYQVPEAIHYLKVQQLFRLGLASQAYCKTLLTNNNWDLEKAGAILVDRCSKGSRV